MIISTLFHFNQYIHSKFYKSVFIMDNSNEKKSLLDTTDIESRIILLKRRAAEADFLREERDLLINRLKLYNPDYIWPDSGVNKCLNMPTDKELEIIQITNEKLTAENDKLTMQNKDLIAANSKLNILIKELEQKLGDYEKVQKDVKSLMEENANLQERLQNMSTLEDEKEQLLLEKQQLNDDLKEMCTLNKSDDPSSNSKLLLQKLYNRFENLSKEKTSILNSLYSKDIQIDVLNGKVSQLNARLQEPYIAAKIKLSMGKTLNEQEAYMWAIHNLEITNKKMNCELQIITEKFNSLTEKYKDIPKNIGVAKGAKAVSPVELRNALLALQDADKEYNQNVPLIWGEEYDKYEYLGSESGSTAPVSRTLSIESMHGIQNDETRLAKLAILADDHHTMVELEYKMKNLKLFLKTEGAVKRGFYPLGQKQDVDSRMRITKTVSRIETV